MRIALVGAGRIGRAHLDILAEVPEVRIVGVCDVDRDRAQAAAHRFKANVYSSYQRMFEELEPDAAYVCVPPFARGDIEMAAIECKIHLFVERPVSLQLERAYATADAIESAGLVSAVGHYWRYSDVVEEVHSYLGDRHVHLAIGSYVTSMPTASWWRQKDLSGGQVVEQSSDMLDLMRYLCGEVRRVTAVSMAGYMADKIDNYTVEDASCATLELASGGIGTLVSADFVEAGQRISLDLYCGEIMFRIGEDASRLELAEPGKTVVLEALEDPRLVADRAFIHAVDTGDRTGILADFRSGVDTLALALAINYAMDQHEPALLTKFIRVPGEAKALEKKAKARQKKAKAVAKKAKPRGKNG